MLRVAFASVGERVKVLVLSLLSVTGRKLLPRSAAMS